VTVDLGVVLLAVLTAFGYAVLLPARLRGWALLLLSLLAVYWLQSPLPIRFSDYIFPTATIVLSVGVWWLLRPLSEEGGRLFLTREDKLTLLLLVGVMVGMAFNRFLPAELRLTPSRPPSPLVVGLALLMLGLIIGGLSLLNRGATFQKGSTSTKLTLTAGIAAIVLLFVLLKTEPLAAAVSGWWRAAANQDVSLASMNDLSWLGFSYIAFRLIHTLRDRQTGILPPLSLREFMTYIIFFPAYIAGPIDRAERFVGDLRAVPGMAGLDAGRMGAGFGRIAMGLFKKFVIADSLAMGLALSPANAGQIGSTAGAWLLLYGYAFRLYFDFSGYTDMAIGIGLLFGIRLPENFRRPYLRTTLAEFWQSWHITLSDWVRFYVFSPMSRSLLRRKPRPSPTLIVLSAQMATMIIIGLWHGVTWNFLIWGAWHGLGLFAHKMWSDRTRRWYRRAQERPFTRRAWAVGGWFLTFHYVVLGWVWFVLPEPEQSVGFFGRLVGVS
jgi:D-alanyl-lipoteichoic acid acyltransferase DltB (MBOAT superfamily)